MQWFYDGQIRRYLTQIVRVLSNFTVKYGDGSLHQVPVLYGDPDRQVASIMRQNSENVVNSVPRISVYITNLDIDLSRLSDQTYVGKMHFRERDVNSGAYTGAQGRNYTVERLMPTPFKLNVKVDIWSSSTDQKLQILEQILVLFNPSLELQTTDNYIDWTSLSVLNLSKVSWSSRSVPVGNDTPIDIATLELETPIWISPPVKVKHLGVITKIITNIYGSAGDYPPGYATDLGIDPALQSDGGNKIFSDLLSREVVTISGFKILVYDGKASLLPSDGGIMPPEPNLGISTPITAVKSWEELFAQYPGQYVAGSSMIYLQQPSGSFVIGTIALNPLDSTSLTVNWNPDTFPSNTGIDSSGYFSTDTNYNPGVSFRPTSPGTFDGIIDPTQTGPNDAKFIAKFGALAAGRRYLLTENIGDATNSTPASAWGSVVAKANDIIEYTGTGWNVIFHASQEADTMVWQTNIYTGMQYLWNGVAWTKSFEGEYTPDLWKIVL